MISTYIEKVHFRLFVMPCCGHHQCWVNPRLPTYCSECGTMVLAKLRTEGDITRVSDDKAELRYRA